MMIPTQFSKTESTSPNKVRIQDYVTDRYMDQKQRFVIQITLDHEMNKQRREREEHIRGVSVFMMHNYIQT